MMRNGRSKGRFVALALALLTMSAAAAAQPRADDPPVIRNPVLPGFNPDPSILRVGDDYYIATSTFEWFPGVRVHHSRDLVHWRLLTRILTRRSQLDMVGNPASGGVWAPCLSHDGERFHLVYTDVKNCSGGYVDAHNYLVTADSIEGPWSDPVYLNSSGFDPSLYHADDGRKWLLNMIWDYRSRNKSGGIVLQEYDPKGKRLVGEPRLVFRGTEFGGTEAPHVYERDGWHYLMTAEGGTGYGHVVTVARSRELEGPYEVDPGNPMLTSRDDASLSLQKAGHASLVEAGDGSLYLAFLCGRPLPGTRSCNLGRETSLVKVFWNEEGWLRVDGGGHAPALEVAAPALPPHPFPDPPARDEFEGPSLDPRFDTLREPPDPSWLSLEERPGWLRLRGRESPSSRFRQSLVARRLRDFRCEVTTRLEFAPESFQQMAGLIAIYDERNHAYLRASVDEEIGPNLAVIRQDQGAPRISDLVAVPVGKPLWLRLRIDRSELSFAWSVDGSKWTEIGEIYDAGKLSDEYCRGFTGTYVGVCAHDMSGRRAAADFDFFEMRAPGEGGDR